MTTITYLKEKYGIMKPGDVTWSHAVNDKAKLKRVAGDPAIAMIESDIRISSSGVAVAVHPPATESDLTFENLIAKAQTTQQGLKLDFKDPEILAGCLEMLESVGLKQPVWLNADILKGNGALPSKFSAVGFLALCKKHFPAGILSVGWTTVADPQCGYTKENVDEMLKLCEGLAEVTFPVRACLLPASYDEVKRLIEQEGRTLTIWNNEPIDTVLKDWIKGNTDPEKTFYDFIDDSKDPLRLW